MDDIRTPSETLRLDIEAAAAQLGMEPSTIGRLANQGGKFYARLCEGKRVWPETADAVREKIAELRASKFPQGGENPLPDSFPVLNNETATGGTVSARCGKPHGGEA